MSRISASSPELARFLSDQLRPRVPAGIVVTAEAAAVVVVDRAGLESRDAAPVILEDDDGRTGPERVASATRAVLSHVQDVVAGSTGAPWPGTDANLPLPDAEVHAGWLRAWFGRSDAPVLELDPTEVEEPAPERS